MKRIPLLTLLMLFLACRNNNPLQGTKESNAAGSKIEFAKGFTLTTGEKGKVLTVTNPWQHASGIEYRYLLSDTVARSHKMDDYTWVIKTPVRKVICLSTTHIGLISFINQTQSIFGVSGEQFVVNESVRRGIDEGRVVDVGYDEGLNYELILNKSPDLVFAYGVGVSVTNTVRKLNELGIPVVLIGEYLEQDPLGKMEWVKAVAAFYELPDITPKFDSVASRYLNLSEMAAGVDKKPGVLLGLPWHGTWYVSGARSYIARLIHDAAGNYIWRDLDFNESRPLGLEKIYEKALMADFWVNPGEARTKNEILSVDPRFDKLPPLINDRVYNNDNRLSSTGGNDFYETGVVEPDVILSDLISILHPHLLPSHTLKYYRKIN